MNFMLGLLLKKIREDQKRSKASVALNACVDPAYIIHLENSKRIPSYFALRKICDSLDVPYQQMLYTYYKDLTEEQISENYLDLIPYHSVVAINSMDDLIRCPAKYGSASFAVKLNDDSMEPKLLSGTYAYIEQNTPLVSRDIGLFYYNGEFLIRRFIDTYQFYQLRPDNKKYKSLRISKKNKGDFFVIGKIIGTNDDF